MYKHLDFLEIEGRLNPDRGASVRGKRYELTAPGLADMAVLLTASSLKLIWSNHPDKDVRLNEIEQSSPFLSGYKKYSYLIPAALKRLAKMKQVKIDFDNEGAWCSKGPRWIET